MTEQIVNSPMLFIEILGRVQSILYNCDDDWTPETDIRHGRKLGEATEIQRGLFTLLNQLDAVHANIHDVSGLPYGAVEGVDAEHHKIHCMMGLVELALASDVILAFPEVHTNRFIIGPDWSVYLIERRSSRLLRVWHRLGKFARSIFA